MSDLVGNHIVGFPTRWLKYYMMMVGLDASHSYLFFPYKDRKLGERKILKKRFKDGSPGAIIWSVSCKIHKIR